MIIFLHVETGSQLSFPGLLIPRFLFLTFFFCFRGRLLSLSGDFLLYFTMILQRMRIIVLDAGFEPGTYALEVWCATNEPPHLQISFPDFITLSIFQCYCEAVTLNLNIKQSPNSNPRCHVYNEIFITVM